MRIGYEDQNSGLVIYGDLTFAVFEDILTPEQLWRVGAASREERKAFVDQINDEFYRSSGYETQSLTLNEILRMVKGTPVNPDAGSIDVVISPELIEKRFGDVPMELRKMGSSILRLWEGIFDPAPGRAVTELYDIQNLDIPRDGSQ